jgi:hypothetical protein
MKTVLAISMALMFGCICQGSDKGSVGEARRDGTMEKLVLVAVASQSMPSHPLMCVQGGDYPDGAELILRDKRDAKAWVHAVFPAGVKAPHRLDGAIVVTGHFQKIRNRNRFVHKKPPEGYQYFVVASWTEEK